MNTFNVQYYSAPQVPHSTVTDIVYHVRHSPSILIGTSDNSSRELYTQNYTGLNYHNFSPKVEKCMHRTWSHLAFGGVVTID